MTCHSCVSVSDRRHHLIPSTRHHLSQRSTCNRDYLIESHIGGSRAAEYSNPDVMRTSRAYDGHLYVIAMYVHTTHLRSYILSTQVCTSHLDSYVLGISVRTLYTYNIRSYGTQISFCTVLEYHCVRYACINDGVTDLTRFRHCTGRPAQDGHNPRLE